MSTPPKTMSILFLIELAVAVITMSSLAFSAEENNSAPKVTINELLANKELWKGKRVEVSGFYVARSEASALYASESEARNAQDAKSLWVDYYDEAPANKGKIKWVKKGFIRIIGTFDFNADLGSGHFNHWPARIRRIELVERISEPARPKGNEKSEKGSTV